MYSDQGRPTVGSSWMFLIGLGVLFCAGCWWPRIMLLLGVVMIIAGMTQGLVWEGVVSSLWFFGAGTAEMNRFVSELFYLGLFVIVLLHLLGKRPMMKPRCRVDDSFE